MIGYAFIFVILNLIINSTAYKSILLMKLFTFESGSDFIDVVLGTVSAATSLLAFYFLSKLISKALVKHSDKLKYSDNQNKLLSQILTIITIISILCFIFSISYYPAPMPLFISNTPGILSIEELYIVSNTTYINLMEIIFVLIDNIIKLTILRRCLKPYLLPSEAEKSTKAYIKTLFVDIPKINFNRYSIEKGTLNKIRKNAFYIALITSLFSYIVIAIDMLILRGAFNLSLYNENRFKLYSILLFIFSVAIMLCVICFTLKVQLKSNNLLNAKSNRLEYLTSVFTIFCLISIFNIAIVHIFKLPNIIATGYLYYPSTLLNRLMIHIYSITHNVTSDNISYTTTALITEVITTLIENIIKTLVIMLLIKNHSNKNNAIEK